METFKNDGTDLVVYRVIDKENNIESIKFSLTFESNLDEPSKNPAEDFLNVESKYDDYLVLAEEILNGENINKYPEHKSEYINYKENKTQLSKTLAIIDYLQFQIKNLSSQAEQIKLNKEAIKIKMATKLLKNGDF